MQLFGHDKEMTQSQCEGVWAEKIVGTIDWKWRHAEPDVPYEVKHEILERVVTLPIKLVPLAVQDSIRCEQPHLSTDPDGSYEIIVMLQPRRDQHSQRHHSSPAITHGRNDTADQLSHAFVRQPEGLGKGRI